MGKNVWIQSNIDIIINIYIYHSCNNKKECGFKIMT